MLLAISEAAILNSMLLPQILSELVLAHAKRRPLAQLPLLSLERTDRSKGNMFN